MMKVVGAQFRKLEKTNWHMYPVLQTILFLYAGILWNHLAK